MIRRAIDAPMVRIPCQAYRLTGSHGQATFLLTTETLSVTMTPAQRQHLRRLLDILDREETPHDAAPSA